MTASLLTRLFLLAVLAIPGSAAHAQLLAYEGFDYAPGEVLYGKTGGTGWSQEWHSGGNSGSSAVAGSLTYRNLAASGNSQQFPRDWCGNSRLLIPGQGQTGTTLYYSFLIKPIDSNETGPYRYRGCGLGALFIGKGGSSNFLCLETSGGTGVRLSSTLCQPGVTYFLVVRATFLEGNDRYELFINPTPGQPLPAQPDVTKEDLDQPNLDGCGSGGDAIFQYDESRVGKRWEYVSPTTDSILLQNQTDYRIALLTVFGTTAQSSTLTSPNLPPSWRVAAYADFDADGRKDIVVQNSSTRAVAVLYMNGPTVTRSAGVYPTLPADWQLMGSGDFDGDGRPDLVVQNSVTQQVSVLTMVAGRITGSVSLSQRLAPSWRVVGAADFSGDGKTDAVVQNSATRQISVLTLNGMQITGSVPLNPTLPPDWEVNGVGDYDGDGKPDLLVQNSVTRQMSLITVAGLKITSSKSITPTPLEGWKLVGPK